MKKRVISFLLSAMMVLSLAGVISLSQTVETKAAIAFLYNKANEGKILNKKSYTYIYVGGKRINLDYSIGGKTSGVKGKWESSNPNAIAVNKYGVCQAVGNGAAVVSFTYMSNGEMITIACAMKSLTRASAVDLSATDRTFAGKMEPHDAVQFTASTAPVANAVKVNPNITSTYKVYYSLYADEACTQAASDQIAAVSADGLVTANAEGTVWLKAVAKNTKNATKYNVESDPIKIVIASSMTITQTGARSILAVSPADVITGVKLFDASGNAMQQSSLSVTPDGLQATFTATRDLVGTYTVEVTTASGTSTETITCEAAKITEVVVPSPMASMGVDGSNGLVATLNFKLYDQFGNDVTTNIAYPADSCTALWNGTTFARITSQGVVTIPLTSEQYKQGFTSNIVITYAGQSPAVSTEVQVMISGPSAIQKLEIAGVYRYDSATQSYTKVLDQSTNLLTKGSVITDFGSSAVINTWPNAYYLLVRASDQYGKNITEAGVNSNTVAVSITGTAGLALDTVLINGSEVYQSINPVTINGEAFLTYPMRAATLTEGNINIVVTANGQLSQISQVIASAGAAGKFTVTGSATVGIENQPIEYTLLDTAGKSVTKYEEVLSLCGLSDPNKTGLVMIPKNIMQTRSLKDANTSSIFWWAKNQTTGTAVLYFTPTAETLVSGSTYLTQSYEKVITFPGTDKEQLSILTINAASN